MTDLDPPAADPFAPSPEQPHDGLREALARVAEEYRAELNEQRERMRNLMGSYEQLQKAHRDTAEKLVEAKALLANAHNILPVSVIRTKIHSFLFCEGVSK
jgi:hypothetical protein